MASAQQIAAAQEHLARVSASSMLTWAVREAFTVLETTAGTLRPLESWVHTRVS